MKNYHNVRDVNGRFTKAVAAPVAPATPKYRKVRGRKPKVADEVAIFNVFLLDDSSSMSSKVVSTVNGFNEVLEAARLDEAKTGLVSIDRLSLFGQPGTNTWHTGVGKLRAHGQGGLSFNERLYRPSQPSTALYDAIGYAMQKTADEISKLPREKKVKVLFTIFTDGEENSSRMETRSSIKRKIEDKNAQGWVINFMGAGSEHFVKRMSDEIGIFASNTLAYSNDSVGTSRAFGKMSAAATSYRSAVADGVDTNVGFFSNE